MEPDWTRVFERLRVRAKSYGVDVRIEELADETTGTFDGLSITTNQRCDEATRCHNLAHSLGHILQWTTERAKQEGLYARLHAAKALKTSDARTLEACLVEFRAYEEEASEYAAWLLTEIGAPECIPAFTCFARADIECIVGYHRDGLMPIWRDFIAEWNARVARHETTLRPFAPRPIPPFTAAPMAEQEIIQEEDGIA